MQSARLTEVIVVLEDITWDRTSHTGTIIDWQDRFKTPVLLKRVKVKS